MAPEKEHPPYPEDVKKALRRAVRLEWITIFWLLAIVAVMTWAMGGSQAFKTAWVEDMLSVLAPASFLIAHHFGERPPSEGFPYGFNRAGSLAFFFSSAALFVIGLFLLYEGAMALIKTEHPTIGSKEFFGVQVWMGWIMIGALIFSITPPVILGRRKRGIAKTLHDKVLYVDAETNAADWRTGVASIAGIAGIAFGVWWADAVMAILISLSIIKDGFDALKGATIALLDGAPRSLDSHSISDEARDIVRRLKRRYPGANVQIRETGRFFQGRVEPADENYLPAPLRRELLPEDDWRLISVDRAICESFEGSLKSGARNKDARRETS